jgi:hypothetical protein
MNRETIAEPLVGGLTRGKRLLLYSMIVGSRGDRVKEYLTLLELEGRLSKGRQRSPVTSLRREDSDPDPLDGLNEEVNLW